MLFIDLAKEYLKEDAEELAPLTVSTYRWNLRKVELFSPGLPVEGVDVEFICDYRKHLVECGNKPATINKALSVLRIFTRKFVSDGRLPKDPFEKIKIPRVYSNRGFLNLKELKSLYLNFFDNEGVLTEMEGESVRVFLFSCFTGLRFSDLRTLEWREVVNGKILKRMHKTGDPVYIPIPAQARLLLPRRVDGCIFRIPDNSTFNKRLRRAVRKLGVSRYVHCHMARHTFATTCITIGIPLPVTSKLLGHRNLETTLIYAKFVDVLLDKEMKKFDRLK